MRQGQWICLDDGRERWYGKHIHKIHLGIERDDCMAQNTNLQKIFEFWKLVEQFTPEGYPELTRTVREDGRTLEFDVYYNDKQERPKSLPLEVYKNHNIYLQKRNKEGCSSVNIYCGKYRLHTFLMKLAEKCRLDLDRYPELGELKGFFHLFSLQIDLEGKLLEDGVRISPFAYGIIRTMQAGEIGRGFSQEEMQQWNRDMFTILSQDFPQITDFSQMKTIKEQVLKKLGISSEGEVGLVQVDGDIFASKALWSGERTEELDSFYLADMKIVEENYQKHDFLPDFVGALLGNGREKTPIDTDAAQISQWLSAERFPLGKYPSRFSPTLMQQVAINIAISEKDRQEKIFSVNGPPGTGKTTLLKEIIASNVVKTAQKLLSYGVSEEKFPKKEVPSASCREGDKPYTEFYYEIPGELAQYGILVVSNNNGAVENVTQNLPKAADVAAGKTRTGLFDREEHPEIYFSQVADQLLGNAGSAWGLISARMGKKDYIANLMNFCIFPKKNDSPDRVTLMSGNEKADGGAQDEKEIKNRWKDAAEAFQAALNTVKQMQAEIGKDQQEYAKSRERLSGWKASLAELEADCARKRAEMESREGQRFIYEKKQAENRRAGDDLKMQIADTKKKSSFLGRFLIAHDLGKAGKQVRQWQRELAGLEAESREIRGVLEEIQSKKAALERVESKHLGIRRKIRETEQFIESLKEKYKENLPGEDFYTQIETKEEAQNSCPWTYPEYDEAREALFYAALQLRKAFVLGNKVIKRNLFVYESYLKGKYTQRERQEMFPHLLNALSLVVPVVSSTFASVGRFLRDAGCQSLGMLIIDEAGQAVPYTALGALYRTRSAVVVGDPLQIEPVVTIPRVLIDILRDSTQVNNAYADPEQSVQTFADAINQFGGTIAGRAVGCPLVVHRRCIEPMFSISNRISYGERMFNKTTETEDQNFLIQKSGWLNVKGEEKGKKNHYVEEQGEKVCALLEKALAVYPGLFAEMKGEIFIITPFRSVAESLRRRLREFFSTEPNIGKWAENYVGTVHTFQGKDAREVLFVLGCSKESPGAIGWVVQKPNILNVACTRAKYRIAFIGQRELWETKAYFSQIKELLGDAEIICIEKERENENGVCLLP